MSDPSSPTNPRLEGYFAESHDPGRFNIYISKITLKSTKIYKWVDLAIDGPTKYQERLEEETTLATFELPPGFSLLEGHVLHIKYRRKFPWKIRDIKIDVKELQSSHPRGAESSYQWRERYGKTEVVIECRTNIPEDLDWSKNPNTARSIRSVDSMRPMVEVVLERCPRFRILVIGKSGAGKSSLINETFGHVSEILPGESDIDKEITSEQNTRFVLHDSRGFEHGESDSVEVVRKFIEQRHKKPDIKDRLHAIWLCVEIPIGGARLLETGVEDFLKLKVGGKLGEVPLLVVFTKYDKLVAIEKAAAIKAGQKAVPEELEKRAMERMDHLCVVPFESFLNKSMAQHANLPVGERSKFEVPHIRVSTIGRYKSTLIDLTGLTYERVCNYLTLASIVQGIAQKVDPYVKIRTSIEVGKSKYWRGLASSVHFPGSTLQRCLDVIRADIVGVWDFQDPQSLLHSLEFKALMSNIVDKKSPEVPVAARHLTVGLSMVGTLAGLVTTLAGPAAPIVIPIAAGFVLAVWVYEVYKESRDTLRRLMTYIIDLTLIMETLFWIQEVLDYGQKPLTCRLIKLAIAVHSASPRRSIIINEINDHIKSAYILKKAAPVTTFGKIVELIESNRVDSNDDMFKADKIKDFDVYGYDEGWDSR